MEGVLQQPAKSYHHTVFVTSEFFTPEIKRALSKWGQRLLLAGVIAWLFYQLTQIGWQNIWRDIPTQPLFYLIFIGMYFVQPVAETFIYKIIWKLPWEEIFPVILKKRVYNKEVVNYSGEVNLLMWARGRLDRSGRLILRDIKDNTVISSLSSMLSAVGLLSIFLFAGVLPLTMITDKLEVGWVIGGGFCLLLLILLGIRFRKSVVALPGKQIRQIFGLHAGRLLFVQVLQILQWMVVMPEVPLTVWFALLSAQIIAQQIPLVPSKDLLVVAMSAELAGWMEISDSGLASMLLAGTVIDKVVNFILFAVLSMRDSRARRGDGVGDS